MGRVSVEKNIAAFLSLDLPGSKIVVGDGPDRRRLKRLFPGTIFVGVNSGRELAEYCPLANVFAFPGLTDTFGLVVAEAMACGTPVAAFPVAGPINAVTDSRAGVFNTDLRSACMTALGLQREEVARFGRTLSWERATADFLTHAKRSVILPAGFRIRTGAAA